VRNAGENEPANWVRVAIWLGTGESLFLWVEVPDPHQVYKKGGEKE